MGKGIEMNKPTNHHNSPTARGVLLAAALLLASPFSFAEELGAFLDGIRSPDNAVRMKARLSAPQHGAAAIAGLGKILVGADREPRITASHALTLIVHHAGRPGGEKERGPVLRELAKLVEGSTNSYLRREALWLTGFIGGDAGSVKVAEKCLWDEDEHVAEIARLVLERMPGVAAHNAVMAAIGKADEELRADLLFTLAKRGDHAAVKTLVIFSGSDHDGVRLSALEGLARLAAPEGVEVLLAVAGKSDDPLSRKIFQEELRLADGLAAAGNVKDSRRLYEFALKNAPEDFQRERALHQLCPRGDEGAVPVLLQGLADGAGRVRALAMRRLSALEGPGVTTALVKGYEEAAKAGRPVLLRALAARDPKAAEPYLSRAAAGKDPELKITALDVKGELVKSGLEATYLEVAGSGTQAGRAVALKGYLALAEGKLRDGMKKQALEMFSRTLGLAEDREFRSRALTGLIASAGKDSIGKLEPFLSDTGLSVEAARGYIGFAAAIGAAGDKDSAEGHLLKIVEGNFPRELVNGAAAELRKLSRDPQRKAKDQGFVLDWWLTGPVQDPDGKGFSREFEPEKNIALQKIWRIGPRRYRWQKLQDLSLAGTINLLPVFRRSQNVMAYGYTVIQVAEDTEAVFRMGSDAGLACWLNGQRVHFAPAPRDLKVDQDSVKVLLKKGENRILLKIGQQSGPWGFCLRITDAAGKALKLQGS